MLNYGAQAQTEFNYKTDDLANKNYSEYTAPALNAASIEDIDYSDPTGAWITESSRVYQFVNTYNWNHVYAHCVSGDDSGPGEVFADDTVVEIFPSDWNYSDSNDEDSNEKAIYLFEPAGEFQYLVFTDTPESLDNVQVYDGQYSYVEMVNNRDCAGWKNWKNWKNGGESSYETIYDNPVNFIDFVNVPKWSSVSAEVITSEWSEQENVDASHVNSMNKLSEKAADGSDIYRFILPDEFTNEDEITIRFTNGSDETLKTTYDTDYNIHRYTPSQRTDKFEKFGMTYSGSSIGLLQKIGYSLFFCKLDPDSYSDSFELYFGETTDYENKLSSRLDQQYEYLGYSCYSIRNIAPSDLLKPIKVTFKWDDEEYNEKTETVEFTVYNYIKRALTLDDSNNNNIQLKKTVTALVDYAEKADAYFKAN